MAAPKDQDDLRRRLTPPYWWPDANVLMQFFLAASIVWMVGYILTVLMEQKVTLEQAQRDLLMILFGIILGCFKDVYGYTYGSSAGQKRQGEVITKSLEDKDKIIAGNVVSAADATATAVSAARAVAPLAAKVEAPPAAEAAAPAAAAEAAPAAAREAVAEVLAEQGVEVPKPKDPGGST